MTPNQYFKSKDTAAVRKMVKRAGTTFENFQQIALFNGSVGKGLAERLAKASNNEMTELEVLYPERFPVGKEATAA